MRELIDSSVDDSSHLPSSSQSGSSGMAAPPSKKAIGLSKVLDCCLDNSQSVQLTPHQRVKQELDWYLSHPQLDVEASLLDWWKTEAVRYPNVAKLARKYLCLCATSVAAELVFSCGGHIVSDRSTYLKPERVDNLVFLALNTKN